MATSKGIGNESEVREGYAVIPVSLTVTHRKSVKEEIRLLKEIKEDAKKAERNANIRLIIAIIIAFIIGVLFPLWFLK